MADAAACPVINFEVKPIGKSMLTIRATTPDGKRLGDMDLGLMTIETGERALTVQLVEIHRDAPLRCGLGTKLYEQAARYACEHNLLLTSDVARTQYSEGFWTKQLDRRRAVCLVRSSRKDKLVAKEIAYDLDGRKFVGKSGRTWPCYRWALRRDVCRPDMSLAGRRRVHDLAGPAFDQTPPPDMVKAALVFMVEHCEGNDGRVAACLDRALFDWKGWTGKAYNKAVDEYLRQRRRATRTTRR